MTQEEWEREYPWHKGLHLPEPHSRAEPHPLPADLRRGGTRQGRHRDDRRARRDARRRVGRGSSTSSTMRTTCTVSRRQWTTRRSPRNKACSRFQAIPEDRRAVDRHGRSFCFRQSSSGDRYGNRHCKPRRRPETAGRLPRQWSSVGSTATWRNRVAAIKAVFVADEIALLDEGGPHWSRTAQRPISRKVATNYVVEFFHCCKPP